MRQWFCSKALNSCHLGLLLSCIDWLPILLASCPSSRPSACVLALPACVPNLLVRRLVLSACQTSLTNVDYPWFSFLGLVLGSVFPVSVLRIFRLCKLARMSKVFRVFPELRLMMAGLLGSFRTIFWGTVLLAFFLLVWSIIAVQFKGPCIPLYFFNCLWNI